MRRGGGFGRGARGRGGSTIPQLDGLRPRQEANSSLDNDMGPLRYAFHHVFFPSELPQDNDESQGNEEWLLKTLSAGLADFINTLGASERAPYEATARMLARYNSMRDGRGALAEEELSKQLAQLAPKDYLALHIKAQNAGVVIERQHETSVFHLFELSPTNEAVTSTGGRLLRNIPDLAFELHASRISDARFQDASAQLLSGLSSSTPPEVVPQSTKARISVAESRNTINPRLVTEMFGTMLHGLGRRSDVKPLSKHFRDEVLWNDTSKPWRRSPTWFFLRVAMQLSLRSTPDAEANEAKYKHMMLFLMSRLAGLAQQKSIDTDSLFIMAAKLRRRALKLELHTSPPWLQEVHSVISRIDEELIRRWQAHESRPFHPTLKSGNPSASMRDAVLQLPELQKYLLETRLDLESPATTSNAAAHQVTTRLRNDSSCIPRISTAWDLSNAARRLQLYDFESWVCDSMVAWVTAHLDDDAAPGELSQAIRDYWSHAAQVYRDSPEDLSVSYLTIVELWIAFDRAIVHQLPLMRDYPPQIPQRVFDHLLLKSKIQMNRLLQAQLYIEDRVLKAKFRARPILSSFAEADSIAVRYFQQSPVHQDLLETIQATAEAAHTRKLQDYDEKLANYDLLIEQANGMQCEYVELTSQDGDVSTEHSKSCRKCKITVDANGIIVFRVERPLPSKQQEQQAVVFELSPPPVIRVWRDTTFYVLANVLSDSKWDPGFVECWSLTAYDDLKDFADGNLGSLSIASPVKPFSISHYKKSHIKTIPRHELIVDNTMQYSMAVPERKLWVGKLSFNYDVATKCTLKIPRGYYDGLQYALDGTGHTSNQVIAKQHESRKELSLHEYYSFGTLRAGHRLQWRNVLREIVNGELDFSRAEVGLLVAQAVWQAGPRASSSPVRDSHLDLLDSHFVSTLLQAVEDKLSEIESNWQNAAALATFVVLLHRVLTDLMDDSIRLKTLGILKRARYISCEWLRDFMGGSSDGSEKVTEETRVIALEMALTCHLTFGVDKDLQPAIIESIEDVSIACECLAAVDEYCSDPGGQTPYLTLLLNRWQRLVHLQEPVLRAKILKDSSGLDNALAKIWTGLRGSRNVWTAGNRGRERYLSMQQTGRGKHDSLSIQFDLLSGRLLVNGIRLCRLPERFEQHPIYRRILGRSMINVFPSSELSMAFQSRHAHFGSTLHFGMTSRGDMILRTIDDENSYELIPATCFEKYLPKAFARDYTHWLQIQTGCVQFRPLDTAWDPSTTTWSLETRITGDVFVKNGPLTLICPKSPSAEFVYSRLGALEAQDHTHIYFDDVSKQLRVELPRMALEFHIEQHALFSRQFRGMFVDTESSLGTMTGLKNRVVLQSKTAGHSRILVIPYGSVSTQMADNHITVAISNPINNTTIRYFAYELDDILHRLVDEESLISKLFRCYLHALTSHCLPDSFLHKTGTEEAIDILTSGAVMSQRDLEKDDIDLLRLIERCAPSRQYYPQHLQVMQRVTWSELPSLSQHPAFARLVNSIFENAKAMDLFRETPLQIPDQKKATPHALRLRAEIRDSQVRSFDYGAQAHDQTLTADRTYAGRDSPRSEEHLSRVYEIVQLADQWSRKLKPTKSLLDKAEMMNMISPAHANDSRGLGYSEIWLNTGNMSILGSFWCRLCMLMRDASMPHDKYRVMVLLSTMAYAGKADHELIETLLAFATCDDMKRLPLTCESALILAGGYTISEPEIRNNLSGFQLGYTADAAEFRLPKKHQETQAKYDARKRSTFANNCSTHLDRFSASLVSQWRAHKSLSGEHADHKTYINVTEAVSEALEKFQAWDGNAAFQRDVLAIQDALDRLLPAQRQQPSASASSPTYTRPRRQRFLTWISASSLNPPDLGEAEVQNRLETRETKHGEVEHVDISVLKSLLDDLGDDADTKYKLQYVQSLNDSLQKLRTSLGSAASSPSSTELCQDIFETVLARIRHVAQSRALIVSRFCESTPGSTLPPKAATYSLRFSNSSLLRLVASNISPKISKSWKEVLVKYALSLSELQRARRIANRLADGLDVRAELTGDSHSRWDPFSRPDWVLFELENNLMIRDSQISVASEMISPTTGQNAVMQLNMGEGKSSVIVPIAATALADGRKLARVIVLKPLATQMLSLLIKKLGGLLGRRVLYAPVSRSSQFNEDAANRVRKIFEDCCRLGGVVLLQPEHILSFHLMGIERSLEQQRSGKVIYSTDRWLSESARDILDESDELLSTRNELIYAIGTQQDVDLEPHRWTMIQELLGIVQDVAAPIAEAQPSQVSVGSGIEHGGMRHIRVLTDEGADALLRSTVRQVLDMGLRGLPKWYLDGLRRFGLEEFLRSPQVDGDVHRKIKDECDDQAVWARLLFLRALVIGGGILQHTFQAKRWRVNYGRDRSRTLLAVPYRAKDVPSPRSEFSHPDVAIVLTCLSYYYDTLSDDELFEALDKVNKLDSAHDEYSSWTKNLTNLSDQYLRLTGVNMRSPSLREDLFPVLRSSKRAIDFYLAHSVFPRECKEFPQKLSSGGWDLAMEKRHPVTGFSGTNDSRALLPTPIAQHDLEQLAGTNAGMLHTLLGTENKFIPVSDQSDGFSTSSVLDAVASGELAEPIRVILDVGALVLDSTNQAFAQAWLDRLPSPKIKAAIYFDARDSAFVLSRSGKTEALASSSFSRHMDECVVFLDESHTRGVDLKLPPDYRAGVLLGPGLTKDKLAQGMLPSLLRYSIKLTRRQRACG